MRVRAEAEEVVRGALHLPGMWWRVLRLAYVRFCVSGAVIMASAIAFYAVICLGPLGILFAAALQVIYGPGTATYQRIQEAVGALGAQAAAPIMRQVDGLIANPNAHLASAASVLVLLWAALRLFETVERSLTEIWPGKLLRGFFTRKLVSLGAMIVAGLLLSSFVLLSSFLATVRMWLAQLPQVQVEVLARARGPFMLAFQVLLSAVAFFLLYEFMPVQRVPVRVGLVGAVGAAGLWHAASPLFTYLIVHSHQGSTIYGGLTSVVVFSLWAFLGAEVLLFGAHLAVSYEHVFVRRRGPEEDDILVGITQRRAEQAWCWPDRDAQRTAESALEARINGVIVDGGRIRPELAAELGSDTLGLVEVLGKPSLQYVVEAMRGLPNLQRLVIVGPEEAYTGRPVARMVDGVIQEGGTLVESLARAAEVLGEDRKLLLVVSDAPLLTTRALMAFLRQCPGDADLCLPLTHRETAETLFGDRAPVYLPFKEGWVTHIRACLFDPKLVAANRAFVQQLMANPPHLWAAAFAIGIGFMLRFWLSWRIPFLRYDFATVARRLERTTGARNPTPIFLDYPEIALDIRTAGDVPRIEEHLRRTLERARDAQAGQGVGNDGAADAARIRNRQSGAGDGSGERS